VLILPYNNWFRREFLNRKHTLFILITACNASMEMFGPLPTARYAMSSLIGKTPDRLRHVYYWEGFRVKALRVYTSGVLHQLWCNRGPSNRPCAAQHHPSRQDAYR